MTAHEPLPLEALRWRCDAASLPFETTDDVEATAGIVGQSSALEALRFGLECHAPGQNVFVRGLTGTGRMTMVARLLEELAPACRRKRDLAYVHNFTERDRPRLLTLAPGSGRGLRRRMEAFAKFVTTDLPEALTSDAVKARTAPLEKRQREALEAVAEPFEAELHESDMALVSLQMGQIAQMAIFPRVEGKPVPPEEFERLHAQDKVTAEQHRAWHEKRGEFAERMVQVGAEVARIRREGIGAIQGVIEETARSLVEAMAQDVVAAFPGQGVEAFLREVVEDVIENRLGAAPDGEDQPDLRLAYGVNVVLHHDADDDAPAVIERTPNLPSLLGTVESGWGPHGPLRSNYSMIRAGSLLRADGGYMIVDARDLLSEPGSWKLLMRTLRSGLLEIVPSELSGPFGQHSLKPEPIPISPRVILLGDAELYYLLDGHDADFAHQFKVLADFDSVIARKPDGVRQYSAVLARIAREESLPPFHRTAVAAVVEHGARIAARDGKLTARFARIADIAREAAFVATREGASPVTDVHVNHAIRRTRERASLPSRRFQELLANHTIHVETQGATVGQINGLAVIHAGPLTYGFPARITATIGPGNAGLINIEGAASLSGSIHTKGFHILGGLLRHLLAAEHPLAFSASLAFEQSYGGIDGDSASGAEICCLLSALTGVPLRQDLALTGAIDQKGHLQAIGGANEKIEGFYDTCRNAGLTGTQGVIIPHANAGDLMLRLEVLEACAAGKFHVYAVRTVADALEILTELDAGELDEDGEYPEDSLLGMAREKAAEYWLMSSRSPASLFAEEEEETETSDATAELPAADAGSD
jgi:ATP-dependent Lon protease